MSRPNILIIMSDDQGPWALGCAGTPELQTPNIDRLAANGIRFTNFFCVSPVCSPARASFLTGRIPSQHGIHDWICRGNMHDPQGRTWHGPEVRTEYLAGYTAFTDILAQNGYRCAVSGKWHLGASDVPQKSHDFWCVHSLGGDSYTDYWVFDNSTQITRKTEYVSSYFTSRAADFLKAHVQNNTDSPFCLSVHYTAPHAPWRQSEQPPEIWNYYADMEFSLPQEKANPPFTASRWNPDKEERRRTIGGYFSTVTAMDQSIGLLMNTLDELALSDNTIVIFTSDNGFNMGHHGILGKGNGTFPLNMYDESVKVPFIACPPNRFPRGIVNDSLLSHYDFMPTILDYLGLENPVGDNLPGRSFAPLLRGEVSEPSCGDGEAGGVVVCDEYGPNRMLRTRQWKYVQRYPCGPDELYNLVNDPRENENLIDDPRHREVCRDMRQRLSGWFERYVKADLDGANLTECRGSGQLNRLGAGKSAEIFAD